MLVRAAIGSTVLELTSPEEVQEALLLLYRVDLRLLEEHAGRWPRLYDSGIRYQLERDPRVDGEQWLTVAELYDTGRETADCEDLAAARAAELTLDGTPAVPRLVELGPGQWHIIVQLADGRTEDPSELLGMSRPIDIGRSDEVSGRGRFGRWVRPIGRILVGTARRIPVLGAALDVGDELVDQVRDELERDDVLEADAIIDTDGSVYLPLDDAQLERDEAEVGAMWR